MQGLEVEASFFGTGDIGLRHDFHQWHAGTIVINQRATVGHVGKLARVFFDVDAGELDAAGATSTGEFDITTQTQRVFVLTALV